MEKQLNKKEIDQIFSFLSKNKVKHYDVQLEMVDHFASTIEQNWKEYPDTWTLQHKILSVYNEIGPKGFEKIMAEKVGAVVRRVNKYAFNLLKDAVKIPQIIVSLAFIMWLHESFVGSENPIKLFKMGFCLPAITMGILVLLTFGTSFFVFKKRILAVEQSLLFYLQVPNILMIPVYMIDQFSFPFSDWFYFFSSVLIFVQMIYCIGILVILRKIFLESKHQYESLAKT